MQEIKFTIFGNQQNTIGNPIPYERSTQNGQWKPRVKRYNAWKQFVQMIYLESDPPFKGESKRRVMQGGKPINLGTGSANMKIKIFWGKRIHGDCDNIWKGIADALFQNDKYVSGSFDYEYSTDKKAKVDVEIKIT